MEINVEVHKTKVYVNIEGCSIRTVSIALSSGKDNRTLLETDFLRKAGIVLDLSNQNRHFIRNPKNNFCKR